VLLRPEVLLGIHGVPARELFLRDDSDGGLDAGARGSALEKTSI
jgi:hypothetical protein